MTTAATDPSTANPVTIEDLWRGARSLTVPACALVRAVARLSGDDDAPCGYAPADGWACPFRGTAAGEC